MTKTINNDTDYAMLIKRLSQHYRQSQVKAATQVNSEMLKFYWALGKDIVEMKAESKWGTNFIKSLSADLRKALPGVKGLSETNIGYAKRFFLLYSQFNVFNPQFEGEKGGTENYPQLGGDFYCDEIWRIPWGHHKYIIDKFYKCPQKAIFFVRKTLENGWSRNMLLNFIDTDLFDRQGKAITNFNETLPAMHSDLAQEITKDPYNFAFCTFVL